MTLEMAVLGIPTLSVYQDELLDVDQYLLKADAFEHKPQLIIKEALAYLDNASFNHPSHELLEKEKAAYQIIIE